MAVTTAVAQSAAAAAVAISSSLHSSSDDAHERVYGVVAGAASISHDSVSDTTGGGDSFPATVRFLIVYNIEVRGARGKGK